MRDARRCVTVTDVLPAERGIAVTRSFGRMRSQELTTPVKMATDGRSHTPSPASSMWLMLGKRMRVQPATWPGPDRAQFPSVTHGCRGRSTNKDSKKEEPALRAAWYEHHGDPR